MDIEKIYNTYFADVYRYLFAISQDKHLAEELTQETFFKALKNIDGFRNQCHIKVWLCQIGKHAYFDYLRKHKKLLPAQDDFEHADENNPVLEFEKREMVYQIHKILHHMNEPYKEVFSLRIFGELSFKEISNLFGKSESWAKMTYLRARRKIQEAMENENHM